MNVSSSLFLRKDQYRTIPISTAIYILSDVIPYFPLAALILGTIGFIGNTIAFLQPELRFNPCCIYTFFSSFVDFIHLSVNIFPDYLQIKHGYNLPWNFSTSLCKLFYFLQNFLPHLAINLVFFSIVDRFGGTQPFNIWMRYLTQLKAVPWIIVLAVVTSGLSCLYGPILAYLGPRNCIYRDPKTYALLNICINGILPPLLMICFVVLTYRNIRQSQRRIINLATTQPMTIPPNRFRRQFIALVFTQAISTALFSLQWMIGQVYFFFNIDNVKTIQEVLTIIVILSFTLSIYSLNNIKSFYFSMLTSKLFRQTFRKGLWRLYFKLKRF